MKLPVPNDRMTLRGGSLVHHVYATGRFLESPPVWGFREAGVHPKSPAPF
jgi:hypothetical protein